MKNCSKYIPTGAQKEVDLVHDKEVTADNFMLLLRERLETELRMLNATDEEISEVLKQRGISI